MTDSLVIFLQGICAAGSWAIGLFFLRFWRDGRDRLFACFGVGFWLLAVNWTLLGLTSPTEETRPYIYALRLAAFLLIIVGVIDKNRAPSR
jgi:hypothetical protein